MLPFIQIVWPPYTGLRALVLSLLLFIISVGLFFAARKMKREIKLPKMGKIQGAIVVVVWALSILIFLKINQIFAKYVGAASNLGPIFPVTILSAVATFCYVTYITRRGGALSSAGNGFLAFIAGPMVFELPFVLVVIPSAKAPLVPEIIFLIPLFTIIFTTLAMLLFSRRIALTKNSVYFFASMIFVFALWALDGFSYPTTPLAIALNGISKMLSFLCVATMFLPRPLEASAGVQEKSDEFAMEKPTRTHSPSE